MTLTDTDLDTLPDDRAFLKLLCSPTILTDEAKRRHRKTAKGNALPFPTQTTHRSLVSRSRKGNNRRR